MATTPVQPTTANTHYSAPFAKLLEPGLRKIFFQYLNELPEQYSNIYNMKTSNRAAEHEYGLGGFKDWSLRADEFDTVAYQKLSPGLERNYVHQAFTGGFMVTKELYDDEQYGTINKYANELARAGRAKVEKDAIQILVNAFDPAKPIYDGQPLVSDKHPLVEGGTTSNLFTGALNRENLEKAMLVCRSIKGEAGDLVIQRPKKLIIAPAQEFTARVLMNTTQVTGSNNNDINTVKGLLDIVVMDYLGSASTGKPETDKYWFIQNDTHELNFYWRVKPEFASDTEFDNYVAKYKGYMRYSFGCSDFRGIGGSKGV